MDTKNQFAVFGLCLCFGFVGGIVYEIFSFFGWIFGCRRGKNKLLNAALDIVFWIGFAFLSILGAYTFSFPSFRVYMWVGYILGGILYLKTLHKIIAFSENLCYNKISKLIKRAKNKEKTLKKEVEEKL